MWRAMDADRAVIDKLDRSPATHRRGMAVDVRLVTAAEFLCDTGLHAALGEIAKNPAEPNAFSEYWYLTAAADKLRPGDDLRFAIVSDAEIIGLFPMQHMPAYARLPIAHLQNWLNPNAFLGAPLIRRGHEEAFWSKLLTFLDGHDGGANFLHLRAMAGDGPVMAALHRICATQKRQIAQVHNEGRALLEHGLAPDAYLEQAVRAKKRKELRRQHKRLAELGTLNCERGFGAQGLDGWIDEFLALERRGWKGANGSALDCADKTRAMFRAALHGAHRAGRLDLLALRLDGRAIAMLVNFLCLPGAFAFKTAFDEDYSRFSPGVLLQIENLELLNHAGLAWCDSCAAQDHPMIDSIWTGRRAIGRYSVAIGGPLRRAAFAAMIGAEKAKARIRQIVGSSNRIGSGLKQ